VTQSGGQREIVLAIVREAGAGDDVICATGVVYMEGGLTAAGGHQIVE
jgi:hypothetical protein